MENPAIDLSFANDDSPMPGSKWLNSTEHDRLSQVKNSLDSLYPDWENEFSLVSARDNGFVTLEFKVSIPIEIRGIHLLDIEKHLKNSIDQGITLWIAPVGDKSSLRKLRGIEINS